jgi:hypothetical protein
MALYVIACAAENSSAVEVAREELDHATIKPRRHVDYEGARRGERPAGRTEKFARWEALAPSFPISLSLIDRPVLVLAPLRFAIGINLAISVDHDSVNTGDCHK